LLDSSVTTKNASRRSLNSIYFLLVISGLVLLQTALIARARGDKSFIQEFEVKDSDGRIVDLTETTVTLNVQAYQNLKDTFSILGSVVNGTLGLCQFLVTDQLEDRSGEFYAEIEIEWPSGKILTSPNIFLKVLKDLPR
jgi:hypothetical protein